MARQVLVSNIPILVYADGWINVPDDTPDEVTLANMARETDWNTIDGWEFTIEKERRF